MTSNTLFKLANSIYDIVGAGTRLEPEVSTVLIMGGSSNGLGVEICTTLIIENKNRVINIDTKDMELILSANEATLIDKYYTFVSCKDFSNTQCVLEALEEVKDLQVPITIFINNVQKGFETIYNRHATAPLGVNAVIQLQRCVNSNLTNVMIATKFFLKEIIPQTVHISHKKFHDFYIVNISTALTLNVPKFATHYVSSKAALNQFHDSLTSELRVRPGETKVKSLLIYLPFVKEGREWENGATDLAQQLVECLKNGRRGDVLLRVKKVSTLSHSETFGAYRYRLGKVISNWL